MTGLKTTSLLKRLQTASAGVCAALAVSVASFSTSVTAQEPALGWPEKEELKFGFIKLTDMAPLAVAYEKGFFEEEGLYVTLEAQANWKVLLDRVIDGQLDGAHMLAGQPLGATIGFGTESHVVTAFSMDLNGNGITVSNEVWEKMKAHIPQENGKPVHPIKADYLKPVGSTARLRNIRKSCPLPWLLAFEEEGLQKAVPVRLFAPLYHLCVARSTPDEYPPRLASNEVHSYG